MQAPRQVLPLRRLVKESGMNGLEFCLYHLLAAEELAFAWLRLNGLQKRCRQTG
jgi:hypothetical protein